MSSRRNKRSSITKRDSPKVSPLRISKRAKNVIGEKVEEKSLLNSALDNKSKIVKVGLDNDLSTDTSDSELSDDQYESTFIYSGTVCKERHPDGAFPVFASTDSSKSVYYPAAILDHYYIPKNKIKKGRFKEEFVLDAVEDDMKSVEHSLCYKIVFQNGEEYLYPGPQIYSMDELCNINLKSKKSISFTPSKKAYIPHNNTTHYSLRDGTRINYDEDTDESTDTEDDINESSMISFFNSQTTFSSSQSSSISICIYKISDESKKKYSSHLSNLIKDIIPELKCYIDTFFKDYVVKDKTKTTASTKMNDIIAAYKLNQKDLSTYEQQNLSLILPEELLKWRVYVDFLIFYDNRKYVTKDEDAEFCFKTNHEVRSIFSFEDDIALIDKALLSLLNDYKNEEEQSCVTVDKMIGFKTMVLVPELIIRLIKSLENRKSYSDAWNSYIKYEICPYALSNNYLDNSGEKTKNWGAIKVFAQQNGIHIIESDAI